VCIPTCFWPVADAETRLAEGDRHPRSCAIAQSTARSPPYKGRHPGELDRAPALELPAVAVIEGGSCLSTVTEYSPASQAPGVPASITGTTQTSAAASATDVASSCVASVIGCTAMSGEASPGLATAPQPRAGRATATGINGVRFCYMLPNDDRDENEDAPNRQVTEARRHVGPDPRNMALRFLRRVKRRLTCFVYTRPA
jgi:hypothetical protein